MSATMKSSFQMFGVWCAIGYVVTLLVGWGLIAGFLPATPPSANAAQIADLFAADYTRIRIGMLLLMVAAMVGIPFTAVLTQLLARIEGGAGVLAYSMLLGGVGSMVLTFYPAIWWLVAAFRPDRPAQLIYLMNDMAWLQFIGGVTLYLAMPFSCAAAALVDRSPKPVFPRWSGFVNIWLGLLVVPDQLLFFFHTGPFAWNGIFGFWVPVGAFSGFFIFNFLLLRAAIAREIATSSMASSRREFA